MSIVKPSILALLVIAAAAATGCGPLFGNRHEGEWTLYSSSNPHSIEAERLSRDLQRRSLGKEMRGEVDTPAVEKPGTDEPPEPTTAAWREFVDVLGRLEEAGGLTAAGRKQRLHEMALATPASRKMFLPTITTTLKHQLQKIEARDAAKDTSVDRNPPPGRVAEPQVTELQSPASERGTPGLVFSPALPAQPDAVRRDTPSTSAEPPAVSPLSQPPWTAKADTRDSPPPLTKRPPRTTIVSATKPPFAWPRDKNTAWANRARSTNRRDRVEQTTYHAPAHDDRDPPALRDDRAYRWGDHVLAAVDALEDQRRSAPDETLDTALEARLRLLYLIVGYKQEALADLPNNRSMSTAERLAPQDFLQAVVGGLDAYMTHDRDEFEPAEANLAKVTDRFRQAADHIGKLATLAVNHVTLCRKVDDFGVVEPFAAKTFRPQQEVMLYAEVENFVSERARQSGQSVTYRTALKSSYRVFDSEGRVVGKGTAFKTIKDVCHNYRRDFFIAYRIELPEHMYAGTHTLKLTVEDVLGQKIGQGSVEFEVVAGETAAVTRR